MSPTEGPKPMLPFSRSCRIIYGPHAVERHLGRELRARYAQLPTPPAPDQMSELIRQLDAATAKSQDRADCD